MPDDVLILLRIVSGDEQAINEAVHSEARSRETIREAAAFFIEQILLDPSADSYRVLGGKPETPHRELRRNMVLLLKWLHPDGDRQNQRVVFAARVTRAWNEIKTVERRNVYDCSRHSAASRASSPNRLDSQSNRSHRFGRRPRHAAHPFRFKRIYSNGHRGFLSRLLQLMLSWGGGVWR